MAGFTFDGYITRVIDGDSVLVKPQVYRRDIYLQIRFKDVFKAELDDPNPTKQAQALADKAEAEAMFPVGARVTMTNERIHWTYERLEARVDLTNT